MRIANQRTVWAASPRKKVKNGVAQGGYTSLRSFLANIQGDHDEADIAAFGETVHEIVKLRTAEVPEVKKFDHIYLSEPEAKGVFEIDGETYTDYGAGDYEVQGVSSAAFGVQLARNPAMITARLIHHG